MQELLLAGADVNALDDGGQTALHFAARRGDRNAGVARALLSAGADASLRHGRFNLSALEESIRSRSFGVLDALIEHGADLKATCCFGWTPLHISVIGGNIIAIETLRQAGADIEARDVEGSTPLHLAVDLGRLEVLRCMLERCGVDIDALDDRGRSALQLAAAGSNSSLAAAMVQALLEAGASIGDRDPRGRSALDRAAIAGNAEVLSAIIEHDVDVAATASDRGGFRAIHYAAGADCDNPKAIDVLVEAGVDIAATEKNGVNCLHLAAGFSNVNVVHAMLRNAGGANGLRRLDLQTALLVAATCAGNHEKQAAPVVDLLLRWGAHEKVVCGRVKRLIGKDAPRDLARQADVRRVRELLKNAPSDRAWRRRGFFVLCRFFPGRAQLKQETDVPQYDTPRKSCTRPRLVAADGPGVSEWARVAGRLLWLDDGVFRAIIEYV